LPNHVQLFDRLEKNGSYIEVVFFLPVYILADKLYKTLITDVHFDCVKRLHETSV
jgi:hypothetical protein